MAEGDNRSTNLLAAEAACLEEQLQGWGEVMLTAEKSSDGKEPGFHLPSWRLEFLAPINGPLSNSREPMKFAAI
eukprot:bmy_09484T0